MHDLPQDVEALLSRARSELPEPDAAVRSRVKQGVAATVAAGVIASGAAQASAHAAHGWLSGAAFAKLTGLAVVGAVAVGAAVSPGLWRERPATSVKRTAQTAHRTPSDPREAQPKPSPPAAQATASADALAAAREDLSAELSLLQAADSALAAGDPAAARALLARHRARFPQAVMGEEREGLDLIARCRLDPHAARREARAFIAHASGSVLRARIERACLRRSP